MALAISLTKSKSTYDSAFTYFMAAMLALLLRDPREASVFAQQSLDLAERYSYPQFVSIAQVALGRAQSELQRTNEALELISTGIAGMAKTGATVAMSLYLAWQAEAQGFAGRFEEALTTIGRAHVFNPEERFFRSELLRIRGELRALLGDHVNAQKDITEALMLARAMKAPGLALRAAISLHRHLERTGLGGARQTVGLMLSLTGEIDHSPDFNDAATILGKASVRVSAA
jgi:tetratricopeptide (TPR) repeat protein